MNFVLFLLLNAVLLLRPDDLFPELAGLRLYLLVIVPCVMLSLPQLMRLLTLDSLRQRPVAVCVLLFFASTIISFVAHGRIGEAFFEFGPEFAKVVLYYFLLIAVVDTPERFRTFVGVLVALIGMLTAIALAQHYGIAHFPSIVPCMQGAIDPASGERYEFPRLVSGGVFNDPNDLCLILGLGILCCIYCLTTNRNGPIGLAVWALPIPLFVYALLDTYSKGGLLGILTGGTAYLYSRYGGPRSLPLAATGAILILAAIGGRQGDISGGGTAHQRLMFWAEGMTTIFAQPLLIPTGLGMGWFLAETGHVAHNSFVQAYVEFGVFGGGTFLATFYISARLLDQIGRGVLAPTWAIQSRHFTFAAVVGYAAGCYSLTRNFVIPTYLILGLASIILDQAAPTLAERHCVSSRWFGRIALLGIFGLMFIKMITQGLGIAGI